MKSYDDLRAFLFDVYDKWVESGECTWNSLEWMARYLVDNELEIVPYGQTEVRADGEDER